MKVLNNMELRNYYGGGWKQDVVDACQTFGIISFYIPEVGVACWFFWLGCKAAGDC